MANIEFAGFLFDALGAAVQSATVDLVDRNTTTPVRATTTTDSNGFYTISHGTEGRFDIRITSGTDVLWRKYDTSGQMTEMEVASLNIRNPADTFKYDILPAAIVADRTLTLPLITGTDTLAALGLAQTFSAVQTHSANIIVNDNVETRYGTGGDSSIKYDGTDTFWDLRRVGTGDLMIALAGSFPSPDPGSVHIWKGTAGVVTANSGSVFVVEGDSVTAVYMSILGPNISAKGIQFGEPASPTRNSIQFQGSTDTPADQYRLTIAAGLRLIHSANIFAFQEATELDIQAGFVNLTERTAPGAGAANTVRIYAVVDGGSLTDLAAVFQDGTVDIFAQEV